MNPKKNSVVTAEGPKVQYSINFSETHYERVRPPLSFPPPRCPSDPHPCCTQREMIVQLRVRYNGINVSSWLLVSLASTFLLPFQRPSHAVWSCLTYGLIQLAIPKDAAGLQEKIDYE